MLFIVCCGVGNECLSALCIGSGNYRVCVCVSVDDHLLYWREWSTGACRCAGERSTRDQPLALLRVTTRYKNVLWHHLAHNILGDGLNTLFQRWRCSTTNDYWFACTAHFFALFVFFFIWSRLLNIMRLRLDIVKNPIVLIFVLWIKSHSTQYTVGWLCSCFFIFIAQTKWSEILKSFVRERLTHLIASNCSVVIFSVLMRLKNWFR